MAKRTIQSGVGTYLNKDGHWSFGMLGDEVDVHKDDVDRFDRLNPAAPTKPTNDEATGDGGQQAPLAFPEGDPVEEWTNAQLDAYAAAKGIDIKAAKNKAEKLAAFAAAASV